MDASQHRSPRSQPPGRITVILVNFHSLTNIGASLGSGALDGQDVIVVDNGDDPAA